MKRRSDETIGALRVTVDKLNEQLKILNSRMFGKSTEKSLAPSDQLSIYDFGFNEAEDTVQGRLINEPEMETVVVHRKKRKGKRDEDLEGFEAVAVDHGLSDEELSKQFPEGWYELDDEVYRKLEVEPAVFTVVEHHIKVYKGRNGKIVKGRHPKEMLCNSIATPSLTAFIMNGKYVNAVPLYRQEQEFARNDVNISRQVMANWMITTSERYLSLVYDRLRTEITKSRVAHADETPVQVTKDGRVLKDGDDVLLPLDEKNTVFIAYSKNGKTGDWTIPDAAGKEAQVFEITPQGILTNTPEFVQHR